jgi:hypothetical protein
VSGQEVEMQIVIGPQCSQCALSRIAIEAKGTNGDWRCDPFPDGLPEEYDAGEADCPYREPVNSDRWKPTGRKGTVKSDAR